MANIFTSMLSEGLKLFGFQIGDHGKKNFEKERSFAPPEFGDGAIVYQSGGVVQQRLDQEGVVRNDTELINLYERVAMFQPDVNAAIRDIVDEAIVIEEEEVDPVRLNLDNVEGFSKSVKDKITAEFEYILDLLQFRTHGHDIFRKWYIDGRIFYQVIVNTEDAKEGITDLRFIDPRVIRKVREIVKERTSADIDIIKEVKEYFVYNETGLFTTSTPIVGAFHGKPVSVDSVAYAHSGLLDDSGQIVSHLHQAIKPINQLSWMQDSLVIYRLSRAADRRAFYIDVGSMSPKDAEATITKLMDRFRNKLTYDIKTGDIADDKQFLSLQEEYWLPRREGSQGTRIETVEGASNLSQIEDIEYFQDRLYRSLNVPLSRLRHDTAFNLGRAAEITREELNFQKFIKRLQTKFSMLFEDILEKQLLLKGITDADGWTKIRRRLRFDWNINSYFFESKENEELRDKLSLLGEIEPHVGKWFSRSYVYKHVLHFSDDMIEEIEKEIEEEKPDEDEMAQNGMDANGNPVQPPFEGGGSKKGVPSGAPVDTTSNVLKAKAPGSGIHIHIGDAGDSDKEDSVSEQYLTEGVYEF